jgi:hypothetical protein
MLLFLGQSNWRLFKEAFGLTVGPSLTSVLLLIGALLWELGVFRHYRDERPKMSGRDKASKVGLFLVPVVIYCGLFIYNLFWGVQKRAARIAEETNPFVVSVEYARIAVGNGSGMGLWIRYPSQNGGCAAISPILEMYFLSIRNKQDKPVSVVKFGIEVYGGMLLQNVRTDMGQIAGTGDAIDGHFLNPRLKMRSIPNGQSIDFGQGPGFAMSTLPLAETDFSNGAIFKMNLISDLLQNPVQPNIPVRGWAFFQPKDANSRPLAGIGRVLLQTDDRQQIFYYPFNLQYKFSELDNEHRIITLESHVDLSDCKH